MKDNVAFIDNICWSRIEAALSPEANMRLAEKAYPRIRVESGLGVKGWSCLVLKDSAGNNVYIAPGGQAAEDEYREELEKHVEQTS